MTPRQLTAYEHPLARADGAMNERYWATQTALRRTLSTILTVNK